MEQLGWIITRLLGVVLGVLARQQRRVALPFIREQARIECRSHPDAASIHKQAVGTAEQLRTGAERALEQVKEWAHETGASTDRRREGLEALVATQRAELHGQRSAQERQEERLNGEEDRLATEAEELATRSEPLEQQRTNLKRQREELAAEQGRVQMELEHVAGLTANAAQAEVMAEAARQARLSAAILARDIKETAKEEANQRARVIAVTTIQQCAAEQTNESVVSSINLPGDEMKGRIIGRENHSIRVFEQITGVNVMVDDTLETVLLSCFDPVRQEAARLALIDLATDGRIHPTRIEEVHARSIRILDERIRAVGNEALLEVGVADLHPELIPVVGSLAYRTSFGQDVLTHLIERSHLAGIVAAELGLDMAQRKRAAFLHGIGKVLTHESEGPHAIVGADLLRRYGEHPDVVHAIGAHHNEIEPQTVKAILTQATDAVSGSRPGARRESLETYVERMQHLESIAMAHGGMTRTYAMQTGGEVRIMVTPEVMDDVMSRVLIRKIAAEVETNLAYPGQIRITMVRESRAIELAH